MMYDSIRKLVENWHAYFWNSMNRLPVNEASHPAGKNPVIQKKLIIDNAYKI